MTSPADDLLTVVVTRSGATARVAAAGEVDYYTAPRLAAVLTDVTTGTVREVVVDLTALTFLDCAGLRALAAARRRLSECGGRLRVLVAARAVMRPLRLSGLWAQLGVERVAA